MAFSLLGMGVCSQISVDTFGSRFSTLNAKTCRPPSKVPNLIDASVSTQKGRKGNDQHVHRQFYTLAAPRRVQHLGYRQDERRIARHRLQVPRPRRLLPRGRLRGGAPRASSIRTSPSSANSSRTTPGTGASSDTPPGAYGAGWSTSTAPTSASPPSAATSPS